MSTSYPTHIPHPWDKDDLLSDAYRRGWSHGHGIACHNVPTIGERLYSASLGRVTVDAENIREIHADNCHEAESNSRSYSPFEFTAHEFNAYGHEPHEVEEQEDGTFSVVSYEGETVDDGFETREDAQAFADACPLSDDIWEAFEAGTVDAINADLSEYTDEDYGIEHADDDCDMVEE